MDNQTMWVIEQVFNSFINDLYFLTDTPTFPLDDLFEFCSSFTTNTWTSNTSFIDFKIKIDKSNYEICKLNIKEERYRRIMDEQTNNITKPLYKDIYISIVAWPTDQLTMWAII